MLSSFNNINTWASKALEESFLYQVFSQLKKLLCSQDINHKYQAIKNGILISLITIFICLVIPQFSDDRFGIGIIILISFALFSFRAMRDLDCKIEFNCIDLSIIIFLLTTVISTFSSYFLHESIVGIFKYTLFILFYFIIRFSGKKDNFFSKLWSLNILLATIVSVFGIYQYMIGVEPLATWDDPTLENISTRVYSTLGNPNLLGGYLLFMLPISAILPFTSHKKTYLKIIGLTCSALMLICLIFTGCRGAYIGLIAQGILGSVILLIKFKNKIIEKKEIFISLLIVCLIALAFLSHTMFPVFFERLLTIFSTRDHSSNNFRMNVWIASFNMLKDNYLIGIGPGSSTFRQVYGLYMFSGFDALSSYNIFLEIAIEMGILGLLSFTLILISTSIKLHYIFWDNKNILALGLVLSLVGVMTHGIVDTVFFRPQIFIPFWFLIANVATLEHRKKD